MAASNPAEINTMSGLNSLAIGIRIVLQETQKSPG